MKKNLENAFGNIRKTIDGILTADTFPAGIEPEDLREAVRMYPLRGGKRIRPALLLWSCGAAGGDPAKAVHAAAAVEVYHNWTLVHDDIIDRDEFRRGKPSCHAWLRDGAEPALNLPHDRAVKYGNDFAILAGDVQQAWAMDLLLRSVSDGVSPETALALAREMGTFLNRRLISGEALDVHFEYRTQFPARDEVRRMIAGKTGALLSYCAASGGMIGLDTADTSHPFVRALADYAEDVGHAFQLLDDLLGVYGDEKTFGKPLCSDFREGKPTILALEAFERLTPAGTEKLRSFMHQEIRPEDVMEIRGLLDSCGAADAVRKEARASSDHALERLHTLPSGEWRDLLEDLAEELLSRQI